jgi:hypothetical protein
MNDSSKREELDDLLHGWSERHQTPRDQQALEQRIVEAWSQEQNTVRNAVPASPAIGSGRPLRHGLVWFALGVAATVLVAVFVFPWLRTEPPVVIAPPGPPADAWIAASQQAEKLVLLEELQLLFENRLAWIAETPEGLQLEVRDHGTAGDRAAATLAVRVVVAKRTEDGSQWTPIWTTDLIVPEEQTVRFSPDSKQGDGESQLSLWAYRVDENVIAVDSDLSLQPLAHHSTHSGAQISGVPTPVTSFRRDGSEYQVFQTVAILDREA